VVLIALVVQQTILIHIRAGATHPDDMFLVAVAAGYVSGPGRGAVVGFSAGIVADLFLPTTFGMSALVGAVLAYCVGVSASSLVRSSLALQMVSGAAGTAAGLCLFATLGALLGFPEMLKLDLVPALALSTPVAAVLAVPAIRIMGWALTPDSTTVRPNVQSRSW
jgi:rod shape-determining protein MreD